MCSCCKPYGLDAVARWHGSAHDSNIWDNCALKRNFLQGKYNEKLLLLGDSGYAQTNFMMTPLSENNVNTRGETLYQESQIKTRNVVERAFGIWKRRFPILSTGISIHLYRVTGIIVATAVLHNLAILRKENIPLEDQEFPVIMEVRDDDVASERYGRGRANLRRLLIEGYFASL
ncbi:hypothetical protein HF086_001121 [Spodoptera exigua]|uniref:DDE Tnp4 domain-containing protein n=1 Tax=Spodoptera exigua TaxID=7107 RepID=A0A922M3V9_SPOEX|nr:hypothetical protein HF086_001121 [Spodoptera exigua]